MNYHDTAFGVGVVGALTAIVSKVLATSTERAVKNAVDVGGRFKARLTGYWPFSATASERRMEGGLNDRKGRRLITLEEHRADPVKYPYVAVSGDDAIFPYGQRITIMQYPGLVFRVVDTGGHFRGLGKVYRVKGQEPLDICVASKATQLQKDVDIQIVQGDTFEKTPRKPILVSGTAFDAVGAE